MKKIMSYFNLLPLSLKLIEFEKIKALLSNDRIKWREYKNRHIIGYDLNYDVTIKIEGHSSDNRVIVVLSTEK